MSGEHPATRKEITTTADAPATPREPVPILRCGIAGVLMGLANLVPGVSGGTMVLIMGLYDDFISAVADATRFKFSPRSLMVLGLIGGMAVVTILAFSKYLADMVVLYPAAMYALFIGMTLGGAPMLWKMIKPLREGAVIALAAGVGLMVCIAMTSSDESPLSKEQRAELKEMVKKGEFPLEKNTAKDFAAGVLGMSAMVLPGISGAYMLLLLGRYEQILAAISAAREYATSMGEKGDPAAFGIIIPVGIGVVVSVVVVTNLLKWLLHKHEKTTLALLLGILLGSVFSLFGKVKGGIEQPSDYAVAAGLLAGGFILTILLGRLGRRDATT